MTNLCISLFGKLQIQEGNGQNITLEPRRAQELFCYLLLYYDRLHNREKLATLLWPDSSPAQSKRYLRQTLWQLQSGLNHANSDHKNQGAPHLLQVEHANIGINPATDYWLDIAVFEQTFVKVKDKPGCELCKQQAEQLRQIVQLYRGDLLEGWYQDWCIYERERYQNIYLAMLGKLLSYSEAQQSYEAAVAYGEQILRYDHASEQTHHQLMRLHYLAGNRSASIHQYDACVAALRKELDVGPAKRTTALYWQICNEPMSVPLPPPTSNHSAISITENPGRDPLQELARIQLTLAQLQAQVSEVMQDLAQQRGRQR